MGVADTPPPHALTPRGPQASWLVKLNEDEAKQIAGWFVPGAAAAGGGAARLARSLGQHLRRARPTSAAGGCTLLTTTPLIPV